MSTVETAMTAIDRARSKVAHTDVRTELESITASLQEMLDTEGGDQTDPDVAFADSEFPGAAPSADNLVEIEQHLQKLADNTDRRDVQQHLQTAQQQIAKYRTNSENSH